MGVLALGGSILPGLKAICTQQMGHRLPPTMPAPQDGKLNGCPFQVPSRTLQGSLALLLYWLVLSAVSSRSVLTFQAGLELHSPSVSRALGLQLCTALPSHLQAGLTVTHGTRVPSPTPGPVHLGALQTFAKQAETPQAGAPPAGGGGANVGPDPPAPPAHLCGPGGRWPPSQRRAASWGIPPAPH